MNLTHFIQTSPTGVLKRVKARQAIYQFSGAGV